MLKQNSKTFRSYVSMKVWVGGGSPPVMQSWGGSRNPWGSVHIPFTKSAFMIIFSFEVKKKKIPALRRLPSTLFFAIIYQLNSRNNS